MSTLLLTLAATMIGGAEAPTPTPLDDLPLMLVAMTLIALVLMLVLVGVGLILGVIIAASVAALAAVGVVSSAALIAIIRRRFSAGFRAFHYQICALLGIPAGIGILWLGVHLFSTPLSTRSVLIIGSLAGLAGGLILGLVFDRVAMLVYRRFIPAARVQ